MSDQRSGYELKRRRSEKSLAGADGRAPDKRNAIVAAARQVFLENGYAATRVEDIIIRAGVSRPTFYRNFKDKFEVAKACHGRARDETLEPWAMICRRDFHDTKEIRRWLEVLLVAFEERRGEFVVWAEMGAVEPGYVLRMPRPMPYIIEILGETIPAFTRAKSQAPAEALPPDNPDQHAIWVEAYLLIDQISHHLSTLVLDAQAIPKSHLIHYLSERFLGFVERYKN